MLGKNFLFAIAFLVTAVVVGVGSLLAIPPGTKEANEALNFDPFNPNAVVSSAAPQGMMVIPGTNSIQVPTAIVTATTPINPGNITIHVGDASDQQSKTAKTTMVFTVTLSAASTSNVTVKYATANGTGSQKAESGEDYTATSGTLTFKPGVTSLPVNVTILPENESGVETFFLNLSSPTGATIMRGQGIGSVIGIGEPELSMVGAVVPHPKTGTGTANVMVTLSNHDESNTTCVLNTFDNSAMAGVDYVAIKNKTITFTPGQTSQTVAITILADPNSVPTRKFNVTIGSPVNGVIEMNSTVVQINGH